MSANNTNLNPAALNTTPGQTSGSQSAGGVGATGKTAQLDPLKISSSSPQSSRAADRTDEVQLSSLSSKINELQSGTTEREAYIEGLRLEVASGQYQARPSEVASKIVDDLLTQSE